MCLKTLVRYCYMLENACTILLYPKKTLVGYCYILENASNNIVLAFPSLEQYRTSVF